MSVKSNARLVYSTETAGKCPVCGTADLTYGREICQACAAAQIINARAGLT